MKICTAWLGLVVFAAGAAITLAGASKQGGKAEPNRIKFKRGASSSSLVDHIRGSQQAEYVVDARAGQRIIIEFDSSPRGSALATIANPDEKPIASKKEVIGRWNAKLKQ